MIWLNCLVLCIIVTGVICKVEEVLFFSDDDWVDKLNVKASVLNYECHTLPQDTWNKVNSVLSSSCIMLFSDKDCKGRSYEVPANLGFDMPNFTPDVVSYRKCKPNEKGRSNNMVNNDEQQVAFDKYRTKSLTLYRHNNFKEILWDTVIQPKCVTLRKFAFDQTSSIKSDECVVLYSKAHCKGHGFEMKKGISTSLPYFNDKTQSFCPCSKELILGEPLLSFKVTKFDLTKSTNPSLLKKNGVKQASHDASYNNQGLVEIKQPLEQSLEFKEVTSIALGEMSSVAHDVSVSRTVEATAEGSLPMMAKTKVTASLTTGYEFKKEKGTGKKHTNVTREIVTFKVQNEITVPACTEYEVRVFANVMRRFPVQVLTEMEVSGKQGERQMTADEVKSKLSSKLKFLRNKDNTTVVAQGNGLVITDYGIETGVSGSGHSIPDCKKLES